MVRMAEEYPGSAAELCELGSANPFQLLVATILSAQSTDRTVNSITPAVFRRWPTPEALAGAEPLELEEVIHASGFFRAKARSLIGMASALVERYDGEVPGPIEDLVTLPGVGRKTANVIRSVALDLPGLPVDTHVGRLARRLGLTIETDPEKVEADLNGFIPPAERGTFSLRLIQHGRRVCFARKPACDRCVLADFCPSVELPVARGPTKAGAKTPKAAKAPRETAKPPRKRVSKAGIAPTVPSSRSMNRA
ncbi:MAG TPA: endonuclease III [Acidimicrobiales bacterium]